jgi:hypothetical protein
MNGNFALPAPNHVRYASRNWKLFCTLGETIAAVNISALMNGLFQPLWIALSSSDGTSKVFMDDTLDARTLVDSPLIYLLAAMGVAVPAAMRALQGSRSPWDGIPAECQAGIRTKQTAGAYYNINPPEKSRGAESSLEATQALESLVDGWTNSWAMTSMKRLYGNSHSWHRWARWRVPWHGNCRAGPWRRHYWLVLSRQEKAISFETNKSRVGQVCSSYK